MSAQARRSPDDQDRLAPGDVELGAGRSELTRAEDVLARRLLDPSLRTVEAGTGRGRIALELHARGFTDLHGFDVVPGLVEAARRLDGAGAVDFTVQDAVALAYPDASFAQALYLQELVCLLEDEQDRARALGEAFRIVRPGGVALFSFLCHEIEAKALPDRLLGLPLAALRRARGRPADRQLRSRRPGAGALLDRRPYAYRYRIGEIADLLRATGFVIAAAGSTAQLAHGELLDAPEQLDAANAEGMLYLACTRP